MEPPDWMKSLAETEPRIFVQTKVGRSTLGGRLSGLEIRFYCRNKYKLKDSRLEPLAEKEAEKHGYDPSGYKRTASRPRHHDIHGYEYWIFYANKQDWGEKWL